MGRPAACYATVSLMPTSRRSGLLSASLASALAVGVAGPASAQSTPSRETVRELLSGIEDGPAAAEWDALGPGAVAVLAAIHDDGAELPFVRLRTLWAARFYPTPEARAFLGRALEREEGLALRTALESLAHAFGAAEVSRISPFLSHDDVVVREGAIRALDAIHVAAATEALRARMALEPDASLRALLRAAIAR